MTYMVAEKVRLREVTAGGFFITDTRFLPGYTRPRHVHDTPEFCFVVDGFLLETAGRTRLAGHRFDLSFKPAGEAHSSQAGRNGARCIVIEVPPARVEPAGVLARSLEAPFFFGDGLLAGLAVRLVRELETSDELALLAVESVVLELLARVCRARRHASQGRQPPWLDAVRELLHDSFATPLGLSDVARAVGVHPAHLALVFRREHGCTVGEYVRRLRVNHARHQLAHSNRALAEIALACGFCDQGHLTRVFKRVTGTTPARYRTDPDAS